MADGGYAARFAVREDNREREFKQVWTQQLDEVFADVARYYDRANDVASLGLLGWIRGRFLSTIELRPGQRVADLCAGTNVIGISLLKLQPDLEVNAMDRSEAMQEIGRKRAAERGFHIEGLIGDVHRLPYPDNHFDVVTLQYASRHLRIMDVAREARRVLKPGGCFYHCDMLRPNNRAVEWFYYAYLWVSIRFTSWLFGSGSAALECQDYFITALRMFYSADELSQLLRELGYRGVISKTLLGGMVGFHKAVK